MSAPLLQLTKVSRRFGGFTALSEVDVAIHPGERVGLIGPNGSGKTTMMNCISGALPVSGGAVVLDGRDISSMAAWQRTRLGIARSFQLPRPFRSMTVLENLLLPLDFVKHRRAQAGVPPRDEAMAILEGVGLGHKAHSSSGQLTQVELRKMELARAMAANPRLLIADEAMAGLSNAEVEEVLEILFKLNAAGVTVIMIEHIMQAVMRFSQRVLCLDAGKVVCQGSPSQVVADPHVQRAYLGT